MAADLVGPERRRLPAVGLVDVGVVAGQAVTVREQAVVGAARGALPLALRAWARAGQAARAIEPARVGERVVPRDAADRQALPALMSARGVPGRNR